MSHEASDHYATLGLDRRCTAAQIRSAYRLLAKRHHPDVAADPETAVARTQALNAAYETLSDPAARRAYDRELSEAEQTAPTPRGQKIERHIAQDVHLRLDEFLRGTTLEIRVDDPANPDGPEHYELTVPPETAPGARLRVERGEPFRGGFLNVRLKARPEARFKVRGSDLRCDLRIKAQVAANGGTESVRGVSGNYLRVEIPRGVARGEVVRVPGEGLPKPRGGRGDLLVRIAYTPSVQITRRPRW